MAGTDDPFGGVYSIQSTSNNLSYILFTPNAPPQALLRRPIPHRHIPTRIRRPCTPLRRFLCNRSDAGLDIRVFLDHVGFVSVRAMTRGSVIALMVDGWGLRKSGLVCFFYAREQVAQVGQSFK